MRKKVIMGTIFLMVLLSGCGNSTKKIEGEVTVKENGTQAETQVTAKQETSDAGGQQDEAVNSYKGYAFIYDGVVVEMDADAAPIVEQLGEPDAYFEAPSCAFEGIDKIYTYGSFELDTYPTKDKDYVSTIILKDDIITTTEGIGIGESVDKMEEVYGSGWVDEDGMAVYEKDGMKLCFIMEDDSIISVEYRSAVLDE